MERIMIFPSFHSTILRLLTSWLQNGCCTSKHYVYIQNRKKEKGMDTSSQKEKLSQKYPGDLYSLAQTLRHGLASLQGHLGNVVF